MRYGRVPQVLLGLLLVGSVSFSFQNHHHSGGGTATAPEQFGTVSFPTSCAGVVQKKFETGVALLHSFQYEQAEKAFGEVAGEDPSCAIAYWGKAMSRWHALWDRPDAATLHKGWADIERAQSIGAKTERERAYIAAAAAFYQNNSKLDYSARVTAYCGAMERLYLRYPGDGEAAAFYALSLIALPSDSPRQDLADRAKAIAILDRLFAAEPTHPGAAHYLIHAADTPELAPLGLDAARAYAKIAPASPHALHMPSHIFTRLGLWQESIDSNLASAAAAEKLTALHLDGASYELHAMNFLEYAYLQSGRDVAAKRVIDTLSSVPGASPDQLAWNTATFTSRYAIELHHWSEAAALKTPPGTPTGGQATIYWARALGAARVGNPAQCRQDVKELDRAYADPHAEMKERGYKADSKKSIEQQEAGAWLAFAEGKKEEALKMMRGAADDEDSEGVDSLTMPAREMLGDMLMELKEPSEALAAYKIALKEAPNRFDGLFGAARAAELSGHSKEAGEFYAKLTSVCDHAVSTRAELREARTFPAQR